MSTYNNNHKVPLYTSLDVSHASARLLVLRPGKLQDDVECKLRVVDLDDGPRYEALSYLWGETIQKLNITIEGQSVVVTDNLHSALRHLRHPDRDRVLWVDALCIHQANLEEKTQQVGVMGRIFEDSLQCLVWLGEISTRGNERPRYTIKDAEAAFDMIRLIAADEPEGTLPANLSNSNARKGAASAIRGMMLWENRWWQRIWTVQEAVLPRAKTIVWQTASVSWNTCVQAARGIMNPSTHQRRVIDLLSPELFSININEFITPFVSLELARREALKRPLLTAQRWRNREATDARDKVYGLMGLLDSAHVPSIDCDYTLSPATVFTRFTLDLLRLEGALSPLIGWRGEPQVTPDLPTWALDMVRPLQLVNWGNKFWEHLDRYYHFRADGCSKLVLDTSCDGSILSLKGILVDTICLVDEGIAADERVVIPDQDFVPIIKRRQQILTQFIDKWPRNLVLDRCWRDAFWRTMLGDVVTEDGRVKRRATSDDEKLFDQFLDDGRWNEIVESLRSIALNQAFFITQNGYLGIGPPHIRKGDAVWVLLGGRTPLILRPTEGGSTQTGTREEYSFIGDSFVHGVMDGELFASLRNEVRDVFLF